jgi:hypothetical protein
MWKVFALGEGFRLLHGADALSDYQAHTSEWPAGHVHHYFCRHCGVRGFSRGYLEMAPFNGWFHAVNVATLDGMDDARFAAIPVQYEDGRHDDWDHPPASPSYL